MRGTKLAAGILVGVAGAVMPMAWGAAPAETPAANWTAVPDVAAGALATQPATTAPTAAALAADPYRAKTGVALKTATPSLNALCLPNRPSKYALLASMMSGYELWNLKTGTKEKTSTTRLNMRDMIVSPDGQFIAGTHFGAGDAGLDIFSTRTDKVVSHITRKDPGTTLRPLGFAGSDQLAVYVTARAQRTIRFHAVASGAAAGEVALKGDLPAGWAAFSANGKYLAVVTDKTLSMIDTGTAKVLGALDITPAAAGSGTTNSPAFSPDGKELALLQGSFPMKLRMLIVSATTGQVMDDKTINTGGKAVNTNPSGSPRLEWNPDGSRLLYGMTVIDRQSQTIQGDYSAGVGAMSLGGRWADASTLIVVEHQGLALGTRDQSVAENSGSAASTTPPPPATIPARGRAGAGGVAAGRGVTSAPAPAADNVPTVDASGAKEVALGAGPAGWSLVPAELPKAKPVAASIALKKPANVPANATDRVVGLYFTDRQTHALVVDHAAVTVSPGIKGEYARGRTWIERYDLATGAASAALDLDGTHAALDVSASGNTLALRTGGKRDGVTIYTLDKGAYRAGTEFRPFGAAGEGTAFVDDPNAVGWGGLVDDTHLLLQSAGRALLLVELPEPKAVWKLQLGASYAELRQRVMPVLSPYRRWCAVCGPGGVSLLDPLTGATLQTPRGPGGGLPAIGAAFSPDGMRLAALVGKGQDEFVDVFDLKTGETVAHVPVSPDPRFRAGLRYLSADYVMVDVHETVEAQGQVISVAKRAVVWVYYHLDVRYGSAMPEERLVYAPWVPRALLRRGAAAAGQTVASAALPHDAAIKAAAALKDADLFVWHPGMTVKLDVTVVGDETYRKGQVEAWTNRLKGLGITVDDKSPNVLRANSFFMSGPPAQYEVAGKSVSLTFPVVGYEITLMVEGKEVWKVVNNQPPTQSNGPPVLVVSIKQGESAQQAAERANPQPKEASQIVPPPQYVAAPRQWERSALGQRGPEAIPDTGIPELGATANQGPQGGGR